MVRVIAGFPALLAAVSMLAEAEQVAGMTMELHRLPKHDIHPERYVRRLNTEEDAPELVPLHLGLGTHYTWLYAGTPPQRASVIADTGSALMAFPCSGCDGCGHHTDQPFQAANSSTLVHITCSQKSFFQCKECRVQSDTCGISQSYMEGSSWKASVVEDIVYLGGESSFDDEEMRNQYGTHFQFGCQSSETGLFVTQVADGIMGLSNTENHIVAKLHRENKIASNLFSLCFTENGGTMSVGQPHKAAHRGEISYVKVMSDRSAGHFYNVHMKDIRIGGKSINAKEEAYTRGHYIVDSGTTDSYLPRALKTEFLQMFKEIAGRDYQVGNSCKGFTNKDLASLPTIQLVMEAYGDENAEVILDVPPEQYLLESNGAYCGGIYLSENSGGVIGANLMMNRDPSSSAATGEEKPKEKSSGTHPMVLTIVGAVLVVGFLLMMLISVSRRRQKDGKGQLWSRVKGDEEDDDDDDEEEFGLVRKDKKKPVTTKHQRLNQEDDDDDDHHDQSSSDEEDEVFDRKSLQEESKSYMEGSMWQAVMVDELVWVGGFSTPSDEMEGFLKTFGFRFPVGCQTKETGLFITQKENGIMGLGRHRSTVMSYMLNAGRVTQNLFTLCFTGDGGELVFGGVDYSHHTSDVGYTPLLDDKSAYYPVHVKDIRMNGVSLGIDAGTINSGRGVIVDSGTTDTFFDSKGSRTFMKAFRNAAGREYSEKRMDLTNDELAALPTISIILSGMKGDGTDDVQLDIPASRYLTPSDNAGSYNGNFHFSERSGGVLGASTMIGFDVIFDTENKRVGFAESDCADTVDVTTSSSTGATSNRASPKFGAFIAEVILISLVGVALAVMVWTKWRTRSWSRIPDATETSRAHMETIVDIDESRSLSPTSPPGSPLSPRSRAARKGPSPKFTIGSPVDEDADEFREEEEGAGSFPITGRSQGPRTNL
ncbi:hypothetical protein JG687_00005742 [Phytophthora cactorum]|uniref:Peptidase A1 domain-containing protein n=1 Tax=Phytophthora cactorum TaxID=29920 RepID=A0A8T1UK24_9STRA|nr:hypothetical protein JG687_00005742 [Phytophthora cactorum]